MKLVVDANIILSAVIAEGRERDSIKIDFLFSNEFEICAPYRLLLELENNKERIKAVSGFSDEEFDRFIGLLKSRIKIFPYKYFLDKREEAKEICKQLKDVAYFALALKLNCPIWSGEKSFKEQSKIRVL